MATKTKRKATETQAKRTPTSKKKAGRAGPAARKPARRKAPAAKRAAPSRARRPAAPPAAPAAAATEAAPAPVTPDLARPTAMAIALAGLDKKAENVTVLDVRGLTSYADYFVVMTAESDRQAGAIADHVEQTMKAKGVSKVGVEGHEGGRWILVDYGDVVAHVMNSESRAFYDLEGLWADAPRIAVGA
jgi:ribosome-associated protein